MSTTTLIMPGQAGATLAVGGGILPGGTPMNEFNEPVGPPAR